MNKLRPKQIRKRLQNQADGVVLITVLVVAMIITFVGISLTDLVIAQYGRTSDNVYRSNANLTAEAGIEQTLYELNADNNFTGYASEETFYNEETRGRATYQTTVSTGSGNEKIITSTGRTYRQNSDSLVSKRTVRVTLVGTSSGSASVYAGSGGLTLGGSASINNSDININGTLTMTGASRIGSESNPVNLNVAHQSCPTGSNPGATYPQVCTTGTPISNTWSTRIYGSVCATNQTPLTGPNPAGNISPGNGGQGLIPGCVASTAPLPTYDRSAHLSSVAVTGSPTNNTYNCNTWVNPIGFARTWPANLQLNGNVSIASSCDLTITGNVYITGNLNIGGGARIRIADSVGTTRPVIMVDGTISAGGGAQLITNSSGTSAHFISYRSTASCSPNCTNVTGTDLYNSQNQQNVTVDGGGSYPGAIFHAYWSRVRVTGSGVVGAAIGQSIDLSGAGNITFGTSLSSGTTTWTIRSYQQIYD